MNFLSRDTRDKEINPGNPCPKCGDEGLGDVIPPEINTDECYGPQGRRWGTHTGIEDPYVYDGVAWWKCGACSHVWKRWKWVPEYKERDI